MSERILVLRREVHGMPLSEYAGAIRERLPDHEVRRATTPREEREAIADATVVTGLHLGEALLEHAGDLRLFQGLYAGADHLPLDALETAGVTVTTASGVHGPNVAEWVVGNALVFARRLHEGWRRAGRREWRHFQSGELRGSTATVVGMGPIGESILERLRGFGVDTVGVRYTPSKGGPADEVIGFDPDDFHEALARTDYLALACPLTETTEGLIDAGALETLPPSAVILNAARGPVVDTDALVEELQGNGLRGAALDVTDPEPLPPDHVLWTFENVLVTPHNAGHTPEYYRRVADVLAENVERALESGKWTGLRNQVVP